MLAVTPNDLAASLTELYGTTWVHPLRWHQTIWEDARSRGASIQEADTAAMLLSLKTEEDAGWAVAQLSPRV